MGLEQVFVKADRPDGDLYRDLALVVQTQPWAAFEGGGEIMCSVTGLIGEGSITLDMMLRF